MVEKAKLDLLENPSEIEIADAVIQTNETPDPPVSATKGRWAFNKLVLVVAPVLIVVLMITGTVLFYLIRTNNNVNVSGFKTNAAKVTEARTPAAVNNNKSFGGAASAAPGASAGQAKTSGIHFNDFIIDLKDKTGKSRILMCDIVFDISDAENSAKLENRDEIRTLIYQTLTGRSAVVLRSLEERKQLKKELMQQADNVLGAGIVKNIYFTRYIIM